MQEENINNMWKQSLEDVNSLRHVVLQNKDAAWERLQTRLNSRPQHKKITWYWFAAACVLLIVGISVVKVYEPAKGIAQQKTLMHVKTNTAKKYRIIKDVAAEKNVPATHIPATQKQIQKNGIEKLSSKKIMLPNAPDTIFIANNNKNLETPQLITVPVESDTIAISNITSTPLHKKPKVVHVNELGEPVEFSAEASNSTDLHLFQLKLAQQEIYNASSTAVNSSSMLSFKRKKLSN